MAERDGEGEQKGFKVVDRRRFTVEGDEREGVEDRPAPPAKAAAPAAEAAARKPAEPARPTGAPAAKAAPQGAPPQPQGQATPPPSSAAEEDTGDLTFTVFVQSLAQQCMMQLGLIPMPHSGQRELQLEAAHDTIDVLSLLKNKTKGNLDAQESGLLEGVLYELRMTYVQINQQLAAAARQNGPGGAGPKI